MKLWKIMTASEVLLFIIGVLFLWFRKVDGAGVANTMTNKFVSIGVLIFLFLCLFAVQGIWFRSLKKKDR